MYICDNVQCGMIVHVVYSETRHTKSLFYCENCFTGKRNFAYFANRKHVFKITGRKNKVQNKNKERNEQICEDYLTRRFTMEMLREKYNFYHKQSILNILVRKLGLNKFIEIEIELSTRKDINKLL
jgi:hypothetical protein